MSDIVYVDMSNVARWFFEDNEQEIYDLSVDFPTLVSPWDEAVYSYTIPKYSNNEGHVIRMPVGIPVKVSVSVLELDTDERRKNTIDIFRYVEKHRGSGEIGDIRDGLYWGQKIEIRFRGDEILAGMTLLLDRDGRMVTDNIPLILGSEALAKKEDASGIATSCFYPVAMAISLLHCRNVEVRDRPVSRQQRRMAERTGKPSIVYKELVIDAFRKQVRYETDAEGGNEIKRAMHICRGHFATYTDANPLFGRVVGTFWKPMHVRGHKEVGEVRKTYSVKEPK